MGSSQERRTRQLSLRCGQLHPRRGSVYALMALLAIYVAVTSGTTENSCERPASELDVSNKEYLIEVLLVLEPTSTAFMEHLFGTKSDVVDTFKEIYEEVNDIYQEMVPRGLNIKIRLIEDIVFSNITFGQLNDTEDPLDPFEEWLAKPEQAHYKYDHATIFHWKDAKTDYVGIAWQSTLCGRFSLSAVLANAYNSYSTPRTIAHELGHSLGCNHDMEKNDCWGGPYMMHPWKDGDTFSNCSVYYMKKYLKKKPGKTKCALVNCPIDLTEQDDEDAGTPQPSGNTTE